MGLYKREDLHIAMSVLAEGTIKEDLFEDACLTVLLACGPKPPLPRYDWWTVTFQNQNIPRAMLEASRNWTLQVHTLVTERYGVKQVHVGDFIIAFQTWCQLRAEDAQENS